MHELISQSVAIIKANQSSIGACPAYPTYHYCWFRDGAFTAHAMDLWGHYDSAQHFYEWAAQTVLARSAAVERCIAAIACGEKPNPADLLHTRYSVEGRAGDDEWPNFQLDGFGTLLWGFQRHMVLARLPTLSRPWMGRYACWCATWPRSGSILAPTAGKSIQNASPFLHWLPCTLDYMLQQTYLMSMTRNWHMR